MTEGRFPGAYPDFEAVNALPTPSLEALLQAGDSPERVWAAWAIGLRHGVGAAPLLTSVASSAPDPGVRASLAVVLAGHGQHRIMAVLATDDPDASVRAAAVRHLGGVGLPRLAWVRALLEERLNKDRSSEVRIALLDLVLEGKLSIEDDQLDAALSDPEVRIRARAAEHVLAQWQAGEATPRGLRGLLDDPDEDIRTRVAEVALKSSGAAGMVNLLATTLGLSPKAAAWHVRQLTTHGQRLAWSDLSALAERFTGIERELLDLLVEGDIDARPWLLRLATTADWWTSGLARSRAVLLLERAPVLTTHELHLARDIHRQLAKWIADEDAEEWMEPAEIERMDGWRHPLQAELEAFERAIDAAAAHDRSTS